MKNLLIKEVRLASSPLSYIFLAAAFMTMLPGYPILVSAFFICFGIFHSFQNAREANDTLYSVLLPVGKSGFVKAKYTFTCIIQMSGFIICSVLTAVRMTALSDAKPYISNALMNATPVFLAFVLLIFAAFNLLFLGGFFRTAYKIGIPFLSFGISVFLIVAAAEIMPHLPGLEYLHSPAGEKLSVQFTALALSALIYCAVTVLSYIKSVRRFEMIDL
ncbi:MAG: ABC-2 transporter permease [Clostridia bacterium]|nr:ABC-2 transporter permease [Clostridia bacterium]